MPKQDAPAVVGFVPIGRWRRVEWSKDAHGEAYPGLEPAPGSPPFWCEILVSLTGRQLTELLAPSVRYADAERMIAPCVRAWNAVGLEEDPETGERRPAALPAPIDAGPEVFGLVNRDVFDWIFDRVRFSGIENPDLPNSAKPPTTPGGGQGETSSPAESSAAA